MAEFYEAYPICFAKRHPDAIIPTKRVEDAGFDIYARFDENHIVFQPHETKMIPTGLSSAFDKHLVMELWERGSTGTKGIGQRCGVIDSGYRNEIFVPLTNHNDKPLIITKETSESALDALKDDYIVYPYSKAICQAVMAYVPPCTTKEISLDELLAMTSERGTGCLGSSGK